MSMWFGPKFRVFVSGMLTMAILIGLGVGMSWGRLGSVFGRTKAAAEVFVEEPTTTVDAPVVVSGG